MSKGYILNLWSCFPWEESSSDFNWNSFSILIFGMLIATGLVNGILFFFNSRSLFMLYFNVLERSFLNSSCLLPSAALFHKKPYSKHSAYSSYWLPSLYVCCYFPLSTHWGLKSYAGVLYIIASCVEWKSHSGFCPWTRTASSKHVVSQLVAAGMLSFSLSPSWEGSRRPLCTLVPLVLIPVSKVGRTQSNSSVSSQHFQIQENLANSDRQ